MTNQHWRYVSVPGPIPYQNKRNFRETGTLSMTFSFPEPVQSFQRSSALEHVQVLGHTTSLWARRIDKNGSIDWNKLYVQSHLRWVWCHQIHEVGRCITVYLSIIFYHCVSSSAFCEGGHPEAAAKSQVIARWPQRNVTRCATSQQKPLHHNNLRRMSSKRCSWTQTSVLSLWNKT